MLKIQFIGKLFYIINIVVALLLLIAYGLPYLQPSSFPTLSILSIVVSPLIVLNIIFAVYWVLNFRKRFWLSFTVLIVGYLFSNSLFEISSEGNSEAFPKQLKILSYNVRLFNAYEKDNNAKQVSESFSRLLQNQNPDVICIQEYYADHQVDFSAYPYRFVYFKGKNKLGHAIFSKYPLVNTGSFDFKNTYNNTIYSDLVVKGDTLRLYNIHLQSLGILPSVDFLQQRGTERIKKRLSQSFVQQEKQVAEILQHQAENKYPTILTGDFNNTAYSYIYKNLKQDLQDAFQQRGNGLGTTFYFNGYPLRIDFSLLSETFEIIAFDNVKESFSDHYPIVTHLGWE